MLFSVIRQSTTKAAILSALAMIAIELVSLPVAAQIETVRGAPEGFETLDAPRAAMVTVYYGGQLLGSFAAHFTPSTLQFDAPATVIEAVPDISDKPRVMAALQKPLPVHADLLCNEKRIENCGKLQPDIVGVIFSEDRQEAELFFNKDTLAVVENSERYLPLPDRHFSSVQSINGALSGSGQGTPDFSASTQSIYAFGEGKLQSQTTLSNQGLRFDTATADIDRRGWEASTGLFRSNAMELISDRDIAGVSIATSSRTVEDNHKTDGNDVIVYLPRRAFVSIYREGRLYSSHDYEAGNQKLDTSELPEGAYTITLKIQEADGSVRDETRFFAKTKMLPAPGQPVYYVQAGIIRDDAQHDSTLPQLTDHPLLRTGTVQRIDDNLAFTASLLGVQDRGAMELGSFWIMGGTQIQSTFMSSSKGDLGAQASVTHTSDRFSASLDFRDVWMNGNGMPGYDTVVRDFSQADFTFGYNASADLSFGARGNYSKQSGNLSIVSFGPYAEWHVWQDGERSLGVTADMARGTDHTIEGSLLMHFSYRFGSYGISGSGGEQFGDSTRGATGNLRVFHDDPTPGNKLLVGAGVNADRQNRSLSADADWDNSVAQLRGGVQQNWGQYGSNLSYGGNFDVSAAQIADEIHVGGAQNDASAVIIETMGDVSVPMKIFVNGMQRGTVNVGDRQTVFLSPFHTYNIRLEPEKSGLLDYENNDRKVTLYPGNVTKLSWAVNKFYVVAARIVTPDGKPLSGAALQESHGLIATEEDGRIQAEMSAPQIMTFALNDGSSCKVTLPKNVTDQNGVLLYKKPLPCITPKE